jgi:hypothetical protein
MFLNVTFFSLVPDSTLVWDVQYIIQCTRVVVIYSRPETGFGSTAQYLRNPEKMFILMNLKILSDCPAKSRKRFIVHLMRRKLLLLMSDWRSYSYKGTPLRN